MAETYANFHESHNGEGLSVYSPPEGNYPEGTELIFHINDAGAYLNHSDIIRLQRCLIEYLRAP